MDIVYSVGPDNGSDWYNLRMSLRSVAKYAKGVGRIIVAGHPPPWLSDDVVIFEHPRNPSLGKHWNILNTILAVIDDGLVHGEFLYSSDDHFLVREVDFDNYPYYYKKEKIRGFDEIVAEEGIQGYVGYVKSLALTRELLERNGYGIRQYNGHVNTHFDTHDCDAVKRMIAGSEKYNVGFEPTCLFMNVRDRRDPVVPTYREDAKLSDFSDEKAVWREIGGRDTFSVCGNADMGEKLNEFKGFMDAFLPGKCRFEK